MQYIYKVFEFHKLENYKSSPLSGSLTNSPIREDLNVLPIFTQAWPEKRLQKCYMRAFRDKGKKLKLSMTVVMLHIA